MKATIKGKATGQCHEDLSKEDRIECYDRLRLVVKLNAVEAGNIEELPSEGAI